MELYGQIDLSALGEVVRQHPDAVRVVKTRDGKEHKYINISVCQRRYPDQYGRTHYIRTNVNKDEQKQGVKYFVADLKESRYEGAKPAAPAKGNAPAPTETPAEGKDDLPF